MTVNPVTVADESGKQAAVTGPITIITDAIKPFSQQPQPPTPKAGCFSCFRPGANAPPNASPLAAAGVAAGVAVATGNDPKQSEASTSLTVEAGEVLLLHKSEQNHYAHRVLSLLFPSF